MELPVHELPDHELRDHELRDHELRDHELNSSTGPRDHGTTGPEIRGCQTEACLEKI